MYRCQEKPLDIIIILLYLIMGWKLYDYVNDRGVNKIKAWTEKLPKKQIILLNKKLDSLAQNGTTLSDNLLSHTKLTHIKEIVFRGRIATRPLLCKVPTKDKEGRYKKEFTILLGAREKDKKYEPKNALKRAEKNRQEVIKNDNTKRCLHERVVPNIKKRV